MHNVTAYFFQEINPNKRQKIFEWTAYLCADLQVHISLRTQPIKPIYINTVDISLLIRMQLEWWHKEKEELWILRTAAWGQSWISLHFVNKTKSLVAEPEGSTVMITRRMLNRFHLVPSDTISFPETSFIVSILFPSLYFKYLLPHEVYLQKFFKISLFPHGQSFLCNL